MSKLISNTVKLNALEEATSFPSFKEIKDAPIIEIEPLEPTESLAEQHDVQLDYYSIEQIIKNDEKIMNLEGAKVNLILDIIELLCDKKNKFYLNNHNYIGFFWRGLPILCLKINDNKQRNRMVYISVKVYKDELDDYLNEQKVGKTGTIVLASLVVVGLIGGYLYYKWRYTGPN